ncbi:MAG: hypothetical protein HY884_06430 [Deltaproteobacteria bacterium]|nr:hypothetical protein [Deltaproteobacteria bacterium]
MATLPGATEKKKRSSFNAETEKLAVKFNTSPAAVSTVGGLALFVFGTVMLLSALGYVTSEDHISLFGRLIGGGISLIITSGGIWSLYRGALAALKSAGFEGGFSTAALITYLLQTMSARSVYSAIPYLILAFDFFLAYAFSMTLPLTDMKGLEEVMVVEFLALHSAAFLGIVVIIRTEGIWTLIRLAIGGFLVFIYITLGMKYASASAAVSFVFLIGSRYINYHMNGQEDGALAQMILRWVVQLLFFLLFTALLNESLAGPGNILLGLIYFSAIGLVEAFGLLGVKQGEGAKAQKGDFL